MRRSSWLFVGLVVAALLLRVYMLDARAMHHDEAVHAYFVFKLLAGEPYVYDPTYHGPFLYYTQELVFSALGKSEFTARLLPALMGTACVALVYPLRKYMSDLGVLFAGLLLAISPSMLYYSRFLRNDIYLVFFTLASVVLVLAMLEERGVKRHVLSALLGVSLALMCTTKESAYITIVILAISALVVMVWLARDVVSVRSLLRATPDVLIAAFSFTIIFVAMYSFFFSDVAQSAHAIPRAFEHWIHMHEIKRIGGPWYYYLPILLCEYPILILGFMGGARALKRREGVWVGVLIWALLTLAFYSYMQEKVPWLVVHILLPLALLAGYFLSHLVEENMKTKRWPVLLVLLILLVPYAISSAATNYTHVNAAKQISYIQPPDSFAAVMHRVQTMHANDSSITILICARHNDYWPIPWYVRGMRASYLSDVPPTLDADIIIVEGSIAHHLPDTEGYERVSFELRPNKWMVALFKKR